MRTRLEAAVAQEILDLVKDQGRTLKWVQDRSGVKARTWNYYFKGDRPIPFQVLADVCEVLGVKASDVIARAEDRDAAAELHDLEAGLSPSSRRALEQGRAERGVGDEPVDPPRLADEGRRLSA